MRALRKLVPCLAVRRQAMKTAGRAVSAATVATLVVTAGTAAAAAAPVPDYEAPFPCAEQWLGSTRASHSPSVYSVDFNRPDDIGDLAVATAPGVVTSVVDLGSTSYGKYIVVDHGNDYSSLYAHLLAQYVVPGQRVDQGAVLGLVGTSGGSTGPHLHFEQRLNRQGQRPYFHQTAYTFESTLTSANCPDVPIAGDWDGDGDDDASIFRRTPGTGMFRLTRPGQEPLRVPLGHSSDAPLTGDWDGNGRTDVGVRTSGTNTFVLRSSAGSAVPLDYGRISDLPVTGDWDGNGRTEVGVWRPSVSKFRMRVAAGDTRVFSMGSAGSTPVTGDWNGDDVTDLGVFDAAAGKFTLRTRPIVPGAAAVTVDLGSSTDLPVTGDWDGDGRTDVGVWSPATATYSLQVAGSRTAAATVVTKRLGLPRIR